MHAPRPPRQRAASRTILLARPFFVAAVALCLVTGIAGGLMRLGVFAPGTANMEWLGQAALSHAALMICAFLGTVISLERAVAVKLRAAFGTPVACALGGVCLLRGQVAVAAWLFVIAAAVFAWVNVVVVRRQWAAHTWLLLAAAFTWLAGTVLFATQQGSAATLPWWFAFLVMTIAAERLEMTRLMRQRAAAPWLLLAVLVVMTVGAAWSWPSPQAGGAIYGASLVLLAAWLVSYDIARRTVFAHGISRYMAVCLLGGYAWLAVAGIAWVATAMGLPWRDTALHALGLGFIFSMIMGHAPVILPAIARIKLQFGWPFYVPLAALHLSLALRLGAGSLQFAQRVNGAELNAASIALFAVTVVGAAIAWRLRYGAEGVRERA